MASIDFVVSAFDYILAKGSTVKAPSEGRSNTEDLLMACLVIQNKSPDVEPDSYCFCFFFHAYHMKKLVDNFSKSSNDLPRGDRIWHHSRKVEK